LHDITPWMTSGAVLMALVGAIGCKQTAQDDQAGENRIAFEVLARAMETDLSEISGMEVVAGPILLVHNDDGPPDLWVLDTQGAVVTRYHLEGAENRDWEDLTVIPSDNGDLIAIGDLGDNWARRSSIQIYFLRLPDAPAGIANIYPRSVEVSHVLDLTYPDGARDCEAMAYDASSGKILLLTKRDKPPRLYAVDAGQATEQARLELEFLGVAPMFRPPTRADMRRMGADGAWISQPTGMDINAAGTLAAVITYRSLYLFERQTGKTWAEAFLRPPREFLGPASADEEAIAFSEDMSALFITTEGRLAPIYHVLLPDPK